MPRLFVALWPPEALLMLTTSFTASDIALVRVEPSGTYVNVARFELR